MPEPMPQIKAAVVQAAPDYLSLQGTVDRTVALIAEAARNGAQLITFPECWIPGYPFWAWLASPAWAMQWVPRYFANSLELGSPEERRIAAAAAEHEIHVVLGCSERKQASLYMSQIIYDARGERIATRRKLKPTHAERTVFGEGGGADLIVQPTELGNIGALCCWEHLQPLSKFAMYAQDEQIHAGSWPSFSMYGQAHQLSATFNDAVSQVYAGEGGCFVLASTAVTTPEMIDVLCDTPDKREMIWAGGGKSMIFGPDGSRLAKYLGPEEEGLLYADLDPIMIRYAKAIADPAGHYARSDATRLLLDNRPRRPVVSFTGARSARGGLASGDDDKRAGEPSGPPLILPTAPGAPDGGPASAPLTPA